jgi:DNA helicase IV
VDRDRTVTLVGDVAQKIVMSRDFGSWEELLTEAGFEESAPIKLTVSYRSTNQIIALVSRFRGEVEAPAPPAGRNGPLPIFIQVESLPVMAHIVGQWIEARLKESRKTLSAVICRWARQAEQLVEVLRKQGHASVRLGHRDQFDFSPGVVVTNVHQVKGLEFRNVLVVEPSEENYRAESEEGRNLLYVAMTRAEWRLDFIGSQKPSSLLPELRRVRGHEIAAWIK